MLSACPAVGKLVLGIGLIRRRISVVAQDGFVCRPFERVPAEGSELRECRLGGDAHFELRVRGYFFSSLAQLVVDTLYSKGAFHVALLRYLLKGHFRISSSERPPPLRGPLRAFGRVYIAP